MSDIVDELREDDKRRFENRQTWASFPSDDLGTRAAAEIESLRAELAEQEVRRVGLLAEIAGLKSKGPFTVDESNPHLIYCEDACVYLDPSQPQGVCDKLNQLTSRIASLEAAIEELAHHKDTTIELQKLCEAALESK